MEGTDGFVAQLAAERDRLNNAVAHLVRSNDELKEAMREEGDGDRVYKTAVEENIVVIAGYRARVERLDKEISELTAGLQHLGMAPAVAATEAAAAGGAADMDGGRGIHL